MSSKLPLQQSSSKRNNMAADDDDIPEVDHEQNVEDFAEDSDE